ncbi:hypothetical protein [Variovorax sp. Root411]|uniref:hypothetical protein n=1 Tax=Variovorax sp. Root411 TaxID=1736530 RepID=UPI00138F30B0|nr:hypothetical protein [Variovorax sp. Root411]
MRSARADRMGGLLFDAAMLLVSVLLLGGGEEVVAPVLGWGVVPVVPMAPPAGLC